MSVIAKSCLFWGSVRESYSENLLWNIGTCLRKAFDNHGNVKCIENTNSTFGLEKH